MGRFVRLAVATVAIAAMGACGPFCGPGKVSMTNAHVDSSFNCPRSANQFQYSVHGSMDVDNPSGKAVTI